MSMMMFLRGSGFAALGAVILVVSLGAAGVLYITQRGQAGRKRRAQRELYVTYLEEMRDDLRERELAFRERSVRLDPPAAHLLGSSPTRPGCGSAAAATSTSCACAWAPARCPSATSPCARRARSSARPTRSCARRRGR